MGSPAIIACVQMRSGMDERANISTMRELVREAAGLGATYVQTPEMTGLVTRSRELFGADFPGPQQSCLRGCCGTGARFVHMAACRLHGGIGR